MTSLLARMLRLFPETVRLEDLFTEAVARLFERRPDLCFAWLEEAGLISPADGEEQRYVHVNTQESFVRLEDHDFGSRPDLTLKIHRAAKDAESGGSVECAMFESKIGAGEGEDQLERYAEQLERIFADSKTLVYITRNYDPKDGDEILSGLSDDVHFEQLRWHDFYRFLQTVEQTELVEEVMTFMEEQGMSRSHRFSATDLMALSGMPRALEIFDETLDEGVKAELESFAGNKVRRESGNLKHGDHYIVAPLDERNLQCYVGYYTMPDTPDGYPAVYVSLDARPGAERREASVAAMKRMTYREGWEGYGFDDPTEWAGVSCDKSLVSFLTEEDHVAAVKSFFVESIRQLREELTAFKRENPDSDLPWDGEEAQPSGGGSRFVWGEGDIGIRKPE